MRGGVSKGNPAFSFPRNMGQLLPSRVSRFAPRLLALLPPFSPGSRDRRSREEIGDCTPGLGSPSPAGGFGAPASPPRPPPVPLNPFPSPSHAAPAAPRGTRAGAAELATDSRRNPPSPTRHLPAKTRNASFSNQTLQKSGRASKKQPSL